MVDFMVSEIQMKIELTCPRQLGTRRERNPKTKMISVIFGQWGPIVISNGVIYPSQSAISGTLGDRVRT